jgi:putative PIN family toxin of toxin-antitoxin system
MLTVFDPYIDFVNVGSEITVCRDLKDDFLLALAKDGNANYLITGDKDLLELGCFENTIIIKIADFLMENSV